MFKYFLFSIKSLIYKKSYYISSIVYILTLVLVTYLFPAILKQSFIGILNQWFVWTMVVLAIAITITMTTMFVFKSGIEDGTEVLLSSKPLSRAECIWAKLLLMFVVITIQSFISFIIALFLPLAKYGLNKQMPIAGGFFIFSFVVSLFFCATGMLFALISKQQVAMFLNFSLSFLLVFITSINIVLSKTPGKILREEGFSLTNKMSIPTYNKEKQVVNSNGYLLKYKNKIIDKSSNNELSNLKNIDYDTIIKEVYENAYNKSSFVKTVNIDPVFQWITLLNVNNFSYEQETSPFWYSDLSFAFNLSTPNIAKLNFDEKTNKDFIFIKIDNFKKPNESEIFLPIYQSTATITIDNINEFNVIPIFNNKQILENNFLFIPEYTLNNTTFLPEPNSLKINVFSKKLLLNNDMELERFNNYMFGQNNSLYSEFLNIKNLYKKTLLQYSNNYNFVDFLQEKINNGLNIVLMNIEKTPDAKVPLYFNNQPISDSMIPNNIYYKDIKKEINKLYNNFDYNVWNNVDIYDNSWPLLISTTGTIVASIQSIYSNVIFKNKINNIASNAPTIDYSNANSQKIVDLLMNKRDVEYNNSNPVFLNDINKVASFLKQLNAFKNLSTNDPNFIKKQMELDYDIKQNSVNFDSNFYNLTNANNFSTFTNINLGFIINGPGLVFGWMFFSLLIIFMSSIVYARKDFK